MAIDKETLIQMAAQLSGIALTDEQAAALAESQTVVFQGLDRFPDAALRLVQPAVQFRPESARRESRS